MSRALQRAEVVAREELSWGQVWPAGLLARRMLESTSSVEDQQEKIKVIFKYGKWSLETVLE